MIAAKRFHSKDKEGTPNEERRLEKTARVTGKGTRTKEAAICRCKRMNDRIGVNGGNPDVQPRETNARGFTGLWPRR